MTSNLLINFNYKMIFKIENKLDIIFVTIAIFFIISVIMGLIQNYSSVPYIDE